MAIYERIRALHGIGAAGLCECGRFIKWRGLASHLRGAQHQAWWNDYKHFMDRVGRAVNAA